MSDELQDQAEETAEDQQASDAGTVEQDQTGESSTPNLTPEQEKLLQSMADRMVTKALETQRKKLERETNERINAERKKAEEQRLSEQGKYQELAETRAAELAALRAEAAAKELSAQTVTMLSDRGLVGLAKVFEADNSSIEGRIEATEAIQKVIDDAVEARVNDRLKTPASPKGATVSRATGSLGQQLLAAQRAGDWDKVSQLNDQIMEARHKASQLAVAP